MTKYCLIMGKLMSDMTKVGPDITNAIRELTGQMIKPTIKHWKAVKRSVGYIVHELYQGPASSQRPKSFMQMWIMQATRITAEASLAELVIGGMIVGWSLKKQHTFSLSRCKSKYITYEEACQEAIFIIRLIEEILKLQVTAVVYSDNQ